MLGSTVRTCRTWMLPYCTRSRTVVDMFESSIHSRPVGCKTNSVHIINHNNNTVLSQQQQQQQQSSHQKGRRRQYLLIIIAYKQTASK